MGTKVKGLLKGLKYISSIFESDDKEPEMQIGLPTDVKHVAHIGWDGPSANSPGWMNEFKSASSEQLCATTAGERNMVHPSSLSSSQGANTSSVADTASVVPVPKPSRRNHSSAEASTGSPHDSRRREARHSRRNQSATATADSSPDRDLKHSRRNQSASAAKDSLDREKSNRGSRRSRNERNATTGGSSEMAYYTAPSSPLQDKSVEDKVGAEDKHKPKQKTRKGKSSSSSSSTSSSCSNGATSSKSKSKPKDGEKGRTRGLKTVREDDNES